MNGHQKLLLGCFVAACLQPTRLSAEIKHVIAISIDGGRGDFLRTFIDTAPAEFPNFKRLRDASAFTFNARCDYGYSITIPDHLSMLTGRPVSTMGGVATNATHGVTSDAPGANDTIHNSGGNAGVYKASIFDVVHDRGLSTALFMGKTRLAISERSWNATNGAPDTVGADNGRGKIDFPHIVEAQGSASATLGLTRELMDAIQTNALKNFTFYHIADTDYAGHSSGWTTNVGGGYRNGIKTADGWLGQILDAVQTNAALAGKVAILLTADHGGGGGTANNHTDATRQENYTIPFIAYGPGFAGGSDIYSYFENRVDSGTGRPSYADSNQPLRNGDVANLAAALLGLPSVPGSFIQSVLKRPLTITRAGNEVSVNWPGYLTGWTLEAIDDLNSGRWEAVTTGLSESNGQFVHNLSIAPSANRFFRLRPPGEP
jgi:predicted AlkP superfamily pyrophosphatase or phosphodiesterase